MRSLIPRAAHATRALALPVPLVAAVLFAALGARADAATLTGAITDPDGRAVAAARVVVGNALGTIAEAAADRAGRFRVSALAAGRYEVRVIADGFQADPVPVDLAADETRTIRVRLRVSAVAESVVVSAAQVDLPLSQVAESVTVVTAAELRARQAESAADALRLVPGLGLLRSGGRGAITSLFPQGGNSNYTLVLVDGMRANDFGGGYDFAHLSTADVDRIEIVRGPESAVFGADAIGSVVQIVTRRGGPPHVDGLVEGGSQRTSRLTLGASGSRGRWSWGGGAERTATSGYTGPAPATGERVSNDDYQLAHASGTLGWEPRTGVDAALTGRLDRDERGLPGPFGRDPIGAFPGVDRLSRSVDHVRQIGGRLSHPWSAALRERIDASATRVAGDFTGPFGDSSTGTRRLEARVQEDLAVAPALGASAGLAVVRERGSSSFITAGPDAAAIPIRRGTVGVFGELRYAARERLFATAGIRVERLTRDAVPPSPDPFSPRPPFPAQTVTSVNPKVAVSYVLTAPGARTSTRLRASTGTGIRPPDAFEVAFTDNPDLRPERSRSLELGVDQHWAGGALGVSAGAFFNRYDDLIVSIGRSLRDASRYRTDNVSNARARGVELAADARLSGGISVHATYTFLSTRILAVDGLARLAPPPFAVGDPLIRRPRQQGSVNVAYGRGRVSAFAEVTTRGRTLDVEPNYGAFGGLFFSPGYAEADAGASVRIHRGIEVYARVLNLADRRYEEALGYPALRRSAIAGLRVAAGR